MSKNRGCPLVMSYSEVKRLFRAIDNPKYKMLFKTVFYAALRISEACKLRVEDLDLEKKKVWIVDDKYGKTAPVPLVDKILVDLKKYIKEYKIEKGYLFLTYKDKHIDSNWARHIFKKYLRKARLNLAYHPHTLRHSLITYLVDTCGVPLEVAAAVARHSSLIVTSDIYNHATLGRTRKYMEDAFNGKCNISDETKTEVNFEKFKELLEDKFEEFYQMLEEHKENVHKLLCGNLVIGFKKPETIPKKQEQDLLIAEREILSKSVKNPTDEEIKEFFGVIKNIKHYDLFKDALDNGLSIQELVKKYELHEETIHLLFRRYRKESKIDFNLQSLRLKYLIKILPFSPE